MHVCMCVYVCVCMYACVYDTAETFEWYDLERDRAREPPCCYVCVYMDALFAYAMDTKYTKKLSL